jgi:hypothetical protein
MGADAKTAIPDGGIDAILLAFPWKTLQMQA